MGSCGRNEYEYLGGWSSAHSSESVFMCLGTNLFATLNTTQLMVRSGGKGAAVRDLLAVSALPGCGGHYGFSLWEQTSGTKCRIAGGS